MLSSMFQDNPEPMMADQSGPVRADDDGLPPSMLMVSVDVVSALQFTLPVAETAHAAFAVCGAAVTSAIAAPMNAVSNQLPLRAATTGSKRKAPALAPVLQLIWRREHSPNTSVAGYRCRRRFASPRRIRRRILRGR